MTGYLICKTLEEDSVRAPKERVFKQGLATPIHISPAAAGTTGSHLGLKAGTTVPLGVLEHAMMSISANDAATAIGEALAGPTPAIALMMNKQARDLGLLSTFFGNANGQDKFPPFKPELNISTARDIATLGIRLESDYGLKFPDLLHPMGVSFHNRFQVAIERKILGKQEGALGKVDIAKTGTGHGGNNEELVFVRPQMQPDRDRAITDVASYSIVIMGAHGRPAVEELRSSLIARAEKAISAAAKEKAVPPKPPKP
jgi:D-alanyl-D-alanine carboxypeptidase